MMLLTCLTPHVCDVTNSTAASQPLSQEELLQLHTTLTEAFSSVVYFLHSLEQLDSDSILLREGVVSAAVRYGGGR